MRSVFVAMLCCIGCKGADKPCQSPMFAGLTRNPLFETGLPYSGLVPSGLGVACAVAPRVSGSIIDAQNQVVDSTWTVRESELGELVAAFEFTPLNDGPFHYDVGFEPSLVRRHGELVRGVRRQRTVLQTLPAPTLDFCIWAHLSRRGTLLCNGSMGLVVSNGANPQDTLLEHTVPGPPVFVGDAIWVAGFNFQTNRFEPQRWIEIDDGGLVQSHGGFIDGGFFFVAGTEPLAFGISPDGPARLGFDGGEWLPPESLGIPLQPLGRLTLGSMSADGGWWWMASTEACQNPVVRGGAQRCFPLPSMPFFVEPAGVWFADIEGRGGNAGFIDEQGQVAVTAMQTDYFGIFGSVFSNSPVLSSVTTSTDWVLLARTPDGGLEWQILEKDLRAGWVQDDKLFLLSDHDLTVTTR